MLSGYLTAIKTFLEEKISDTPKQKHPPFGSFSPPTEFCTLLSSDSNLRISLLLGGSGTGCFPLALEDTCCDLEFEGLIRSEGKEDAFLAQDECMTGESIKFCRINNRQHHRGVPGCRLLCCSFTVNLRQQHEVFPPLVGPLPGDPQGFTHDSLIGINPSYQES